MESQNSMSLVGLEAMQIYRNEDENMVKILQSTWVVQAVPRTAQNRG
jgi:hypothetical protein